jgi:hypothetical protein
MCTGRKSARVMQRVQRGSVLALTVATLTSQMQTTMTAAMTTVTMNMALVHADSTVVSSPTTCVHVEDLIQGALLC